MLKIMESANRCRAEGLDQSGTRFPQQMFVFGKEVLDQVQVGRVFAGKKILAR